MRSVSLAILLAVAGWAAACGGSAKSKDPVIPPPPMPLLDQSFVPSPPDAALGIGDVDCAQTFITGAAGQLHSVQLTLSAPPMAMGTIRVDVRPAPGGVPDPDDGSALGGVDLDVSTLSAVPATITFDLTTTAINVTASVPLAIVARRTAGMGDVAFVHGLAAGGYGNGSAYRRGGMVWVSSTPLDFGFQTFVLP